MLKLSVIALGIFLTVLARAAGAADCATWQACLAQANGARLDYIYTTTRSLTNIVHNGRTEPPPAGLRIYTVEGGLRVVLGNSSGSTTPSDSKLQIPDFGADGMTLIVAGLFGIIDPRVPFQGLLTLTTPRSGLIDRPVITLAYTKTDGIRLRYVGDDWITLWDPPVSVLDEDRHSSKKFLMALRFRGDGKLMVDFFGYRADGVTCDVGHCYRYGVLLDDGTPMSSYPTKTDPKTYDPINKLELGATDSSNNFRVNAPISYLGSFRRYLSENELQAVIANLADTGVLQWRFVGPVLGDDNRACNIGANYTNTVSYDSSSFPTLCGVRTSPFPMWIPDRGAVALGIMSGDIFLFLTATSGGVQLMPGIYPSQYWFGSYVGNNNLTLTTKSIAEAYMLSRDDKGKVILVPERTPTPADEWHFDFGTKSIRSVVDGNALAIDTLDSLVLVPFVPGVPTQTWDYTDEDK